MPLDERVVKTQTDPFGRGSGKLRHDANTKKWTSRALFKLFKEYRSNKNYAKLIEFLTENFPGNVKNKTFNFSSTGHLFHSLYAYVPSVSELVKERKQIRLQTECITKLFNNTINDFKLYTELYNFIDQQQQQQQLNGGNAGNEHDYCCPCQLLQKSLANTKKYVESLNRKQFDIKPPKFKKELFDNILYKYSLNYKNLLLKKKEKHNTNLCNNNINSSGGGGTNNDGNSNNNKNGICKRKKKIKQRQILDNKIIYLHNNNNSCNISNSNGYGDNFTDNIKLANMSGLSIKSCKHKFVTVESQTRAGDEIVSFIRYCKLCQMRSDGGETDDNNN
ncbi:lef5 [Catopsilia pomona nucleopolyhedrovirus]|uniref:Lef5 n=1 Tax=Catopsilia pomona nucleopolyhedrovirus TaxID=1850906 RepID=A0A172WZC0_9ABAC|nr:lef5 [Catopsilia pomona nucleopolyhedrovirus]ANF29695.1 lef5 [Catopsilia pomona nucleopolyhedrovirus]